MFIQPTSGITQRGGYMRKIISLTSGSPKRTTEPFFDSLNGYFKSLITGKSIKKNNEVKEGLTVWESENCDDRDCTECLFGKSQNWISALNYRGVMDLCDLIEKDQEGELKRNKCVDIFDAHVILPGSFESSR